MFYFFALSFWLAIRRRNNQIKYEDFSFLEVDGNGNWKMCRRNYLTCSRWLRKILFGKLIPYSQYAMFGQWENPTRESDRFFDFEKSHCLCYFCLSEDEDKIPRTIPVWMLLSFRFFFCLYHHMPSERFRTHIALRLSYFFFLRQFDLITFFQDETIT